MRKEEQDKRQSISSLDQHSPSGTTTNRQLASASGVGLDKPFSYSSAVEGSDAEWDASGESEPASSSVLRQQLG